MFSCFFCSKSLLISVFVPESLVESCILVAHEGDPPALSVAEVENLEKTKTILDSLKNKLDIQIIFFIRIRPRHAVVFQVCVEPDRPARAVEGEGGVLGELVPALDLRNGNEKKT